MAAKSFFHDRAVVQDTTAAREIPTGVSAVHGAARRLGIDFYRVPGNGRRYLTVAQADAVAQDILNRRKC